MSPLYAVTCVANPIRWKSRTLLFRRFADPLIAAGVKLYVVECAFGERPFELHDHPGIVHIGVRADGGALVWSKENLLNIGISRLPDEAKYIATLDADIIFRDPMWHDETVHALQHYPVVQPWGDCYDLGPNGHHMEVHRSFCRLVYEGKPIVQGPNAKSGPYHFGHPGYAWAWRREALTQLGGLIETAGLGAADHHMALALIGRVDDSIPGNLTEGYKAPLRLWQSRAERHICRNISYVPGTIEHPFHGDKQLRQYVSRWDILSSERFDPSTDLRKNVNGVIELAGNKPGLRTKIDRYFRSRNEDANSIS